MSRPAITSPVARSIPVSDPHRSATFYREILGFEIRGEQAIQGPARISFGPPSLHKAVLFFETGDIEAMHAAVAEKGGCPTQIERVNWIKQSMFAVRDPDGHTLWFGQSFNQPGEPRPSLLRQALPELPFDDVGAAVTYYVNVLGFHINYQQPDLGVMDRDRITILLIARGPGHTGIGSFEVYVEDADALYAELQSRGANLQGEPVSHPWGLRDFRVLDLENNRITFAQPFE